MRRVETANSVFLIDEESRRFCRMPKAENARPFDEHPEWDMEWFEFTGSVNYFYDRLEITGLPTDLFKGGFICTSPVLSDSAVAV